jgi:hypothetical protein
VTLPPEAAGDAAAEPAAEEPAELAADVGLDLAELQPAASAKPDAATTPRRRFRGRTGFLQFV